MNSTPTPDANASQDRRCAHCGATVGPATGVSTAQLCHQCGKPRDSSLDSSSVEATGVFGVDPEATLDLPSKGSTQDDVDATVASAPSQSTAKWSANQPAEHVGNIGRFEIRQRLGQGAFGVVYRAYDPVLDRDVALKVPRLVARDPREIEFFFGEAKAAARLRHPNIVAVFESGKAEDFYYIASEFVEGRTLAERLESDRPPIREAVQWLQELAMATAYAHGEGIVHRDIKPANIMICQTGRPQLMDFGLAKSQRVRDEGKSDGSVIGTPSYMSPEQARGDVQLTGPLSDQYSLGAVLYQMLTGRKPYADATQSVVELVASEAVIPVAPSSLDATVSKDLEACCLKAMHKSVAQRYNSALDFAADLRRWLRGEPVHARPISTVERLWRWCHRNPAVASLTAAVALLLTAGALTATVFAIQYRDLAARERIAAEHAEIALADSYANSGLVAGDAGNSSQAVLWFANAAWQAQQDPHREHANRIRMRNWCRELPLPTVALTHGERVKELSFHPSGMSMLTLSYSQQCRLWDLDSSQPIELPTELQTASAAAWSPDGRWLAIGQNERVVLSSFPDSTQHQEIVHAGSILALHFSSDSQHLAIGGDNVRVWDVERQQFASPALAHPQPVVKLLFNARGNRLVTAARDEAVRVFVIDGDQTRAEPLFPPLTNLGTYGNPDLPCSPLLIDEDRGLLTLTDKLELTWWNAETGERIRGVPSTQDVFSVACSDDGEQFVVCCYKSAQVWDVATGARMGEPLVHDNFVYSASFSHDGQSVVTASADRQVGRWNTKTGLPLGQKLAHQGEVDLVVWAPHGERFATAQADGLVRVWQVPANDGPFIRHVATPQPESFLTLSSDGKVMVPAGWNHGRGPHPVQSYLVETGQPDRDAVVPAGAANQVALSPDGNRLVTLSSTSANALRPADQNLLNYEPGVIEFWNRLTGKPLYEPLSTLVEPVGVSWSADGRYVAVICGQGQILVIDADTGQVRHLCEQGASMIPRYMVRGWIRFAPQGSLFATWGMSNVVRLWDANSGQLVYELLHGERCHDVKFSAQGDLLATMSMDGTAGVWDSATGAALSRLKHPDWVFTGAFSRDGRQLLTACRDRMTRLWDWESQRLACPAMEHDNEVFGAAFADDERAILTCGLDHRASTWERFTGKPLARDFQLSGPVYEVAVTANEQHAVFAGHTQSLSVVRLADLFDPVSEFDLNSLRTVGEIVAGQRVLGGGVVNLTSDEWLARWSAFYPSHPRYYHSFHNAKTAGPVKRTTSIAAAGEGK